jgi:hypothetical protein
LAFATVVLLLLLSEISLARTGRTQSGYKFSVRRCC